jgi:hypothetical protein
LGFPHLGNVGLGKHRLFFALLWGNGGGLGRWLLLAIGAILAAFLALLLAIGAILAAFLALLLAIGAILAAFLALLLALAAILAAFLALLLALAAILAAFLALLLAIGGSFDGGGLGRCLFSPARRN